MTFDEWFDAYVRAQPYDVNRAECEAAWQASRREALREAAKVCADPLDRPVQQRIFALAEK